jgi:multimeric flavodoxin WrbA
MTGTSVLGVAGSPRRGGNTETSLDEVLMGAAEAGADVKTSAINDSALMGDTHAAGFDAVKTLK